MDQEPPKLFNPPISGKIIVKNDPKQVLQPIQMTKNT
jgi:hypothetical protein